MFVCPTLVKPLAPAYTHGAHSTVRVFTPKRQQNDNTTVIHFLLSTEIITLCLRTMETGSELSKTVAIFIVQKILLNETGFKWTYICHTHERFYAVGTVLSNMINQLVETQAVRLLKHVVRCYLRLSDNLRCVALPNYPIRDSHACVTQGPRSAQSVSSRGAS